MATTAAAAKAPPVEVAPPAVAPKKKNKRVLIIAVLAVVLSAAAAGAWFFLFNEADDGDQPRVSSKPAVFLPVDQFTVNLQPEEGQQYLQVAMTLKVVDQAAADSIKAQMPEVRSRVLLLLSSKKPSQLVTLDGKNKLIEEIVLEVEGSLPNEKGAKPSKKKSEPEGKKAKGAKAKAKSQEAEAPQPPAPSRVMAVYFTHFIVQ
jgi:flagellar FliL protein